MDFVSLLRDGIKDGDWSKICSAFEILKGEKLSPPKSFTIEQFNFALKLIQSNTEDGFKPDQMILLTNSQVDENIKNKKSKNAKIILETTDQDEKLMELETNTKSIYGNPIKLIGGESNKDELTKNIEKQQKRNKDNPRTRRLPHVKYTIKCADCDKEFISSVKSSVEIGQKCSKCIKEIGNRSRSDE